MDEFIFISPYFFVRAMADKSGRVLAYTVTLRRGRFHPQLWGRGLPGSSANVGDERLGRFTIAEAADAQYPVGPNGVEAFLGARRWRYVEIYYFGNPGLYQWYVVGLNDAGLADADTLGVITLLGTGHGKYGRFVDTSQPFNWNETEEAELQAFLQRPGIKHFRETARPNVYGVASQRGFEAVRSSPVGPDLDQVRVFPS